MCASLYQRNMELMLSVSSALLLLSMQQVSTHAHSMPAARAISQVFQILVKPGFFDAWTKSAMSWKETSPSDQVCERMAYGSVAARGARLETLRV